MSRNGCVLAVVLVTALCGQIPAYAVQYDIHEIGAFHCNVRELNDLGQFTGVTDDVKVVRFDIYGNKTILGDNGWGNGINNAGQVVSGSTLDINNKGETCGIGASGHEGFFSSGDDSYLISSLDGDVQPYVLNDSGLIAGVVVAPDAGYGRAFSWSLDSGFNYLPESGVYGYDSVRGINSQGRIVGTSVGGAMGSHAVVWNPDGGLVDLTPEGWGDGYDINDAGYIVGNRGSNSIPVVWTPGGEVVYLPKLSGSTISVPYAINNKGIIVGYCYMPDTAQSHMVYWNIVPEPVGISVLLSGLGFSLLLRRRRSRQ